MFNLIQQPKPHFRKPDMRHFAPTSDSGSDTLLHFNYKLSDLQQEIEKRTFYLGKFRKTEEAQHLLDLIGMSRDEGDLLYPFMKAAMADVYDNINAHTLHITKKYEWKDMSSVTAYGPTSQSVAISSPSLVIAPNYNTDRLHVSGSFKTSLGTNNSTLFDKGVEIKATLSLKTQIVATDGSTVDRTRNDVSFKIPHLGVICSSYTSVNETWQIIPVDIDWKDLVNVDTIAVEKLHPTSPVSNPSYTAGSAILKAKFPVQYHVGDVLDDNGNYYRVLSECDSNTFSVNDPNMAEQIAAGDLFSDGINYYLNVPGYMDISSAAPLDNAILEALVNRVIWKWLVLSYPEEAKTYDELYLDAVKSMVARCNVFQKNWQKTPRVF